MGSTTGDHIKIGTEGQCLRMEAFTLTTDNPNVQVTYQGHVENIGWQEPVSNGAVAGTEGQALRIECFRLQLTGAEAPNYAIYYRPHVAEYGWLDWAKNGGSAGTSQQALRCEALEIIIQPVNNPAPGELGQPAIEAIDRAHGQNLFLVNMQRRDSGQQTYLTGMPYTADAFPSYAGAPAVTLNNNQATFSDTEYTPVSFEVYNPLDNLGRCTYTVASIGRDLMPTAQRGDISSVKPSGWTNAKYDFIDGDYLFNRCHLIGFQLTGENANANNLVTGTRYCNTDGMLNFENKVADYIKSTNNHVAYKAIPIFYGSNLICSGISLQAKSVEDAGAGINFNVFVYNIQPDVAICYKTGENASIKVDPQPQPAPEPAPTPEPQPTPQPTPEPQPQPAPTPQAQQYILNTNSHVFHLPTCPSVGRMSEKNKQVFSGTRDQVIAQGYTPCKNCNP